MKKKNRADKFKSISTRSPKRYCDLPVFHTKKIAIEGLKAAFIPNGPLWNLRVCTNYGHTLMYGEGQYWHVVPFEDGIYSKPYIRKLLDPGRYEASVLKKERSRYRNNRLMVESWENEGGAIR